MSILPNMGLYQTVAGSTPGGTGLSSYAGQWDANAATLDAHDHTPGKGKPITPAALNINAPLVMNSQPIQNAGAITSTAAVSGLLLNDTNSIYTLSAGAVTGNGVADDSIAFQAAVNAGHTTVNLPPGTYYLNQNVTIPATVELVFQGGQIKIGTGIVLTVLGDITAPARRQIFITTSTDIAPVHVGVWTTVVTGNTTGGAPTLFPYWWGAKGDGINDDTAAFQQCINSVGYSGGATAYVGLGAYINVLQGKHIISSTLNITFGGSGIKLNGMGPGIGGLISSCIYSTISNGTPTLALCTETTNNSSVTGLDIGHLTIQTNIGGGPAIKFGRVGLSYLHHLNIGHNASSASNAIEMIATASPQAFVQQVSMEHIEVGLGTSYSHSALVISTVNGYDVSEVYLKDWLVNGQQIGAGQGSVPLIVLNEGGSTVNLANIIFEGFRMEVAAAGSFKIAGGRQITLRHCICGVDLSGTSLANQIQLLQGTGGGNANPVGCLIDSCQTYLGGATQSTAGIQFWQAAGMDQTVVLSSQIDSIYVPSGGQLPMFIGGCAYNLATGSAQPLNIGSGNLNGYPGISGVLSISATGAGGYNLRGSTTVTTGNSTGTVTFPISEPDANYYVSILCTTNAGTLGGHRINGVAKLAGSFTFTLEAATSANTNFDWILIR